MRGGVRNGAGGLAWVLAGVLAAASGCEPITRCDPADGITPLCGIRNPEDLVVAPGGEWLIASEFRSPLEEEDGGALIGVRVADGATRILFGPDVPVPAEPAGGAADCPGPPAPASLMPHGIDLGGDGHTLLVVDHGGREAVELFDLRDADGVPALTWRGCVPLPGGGMMNDVAALADGGFVVSDFLPRDPGVGTLVDLVLGRDTGRLREWHPDAGWRAVPGTAAPAPNGVAVSADGKRLFYSLWGASKLARVDRDGGDRREIELPMRPDNLSWAPDGSLLVTGQKASLLGLVQCGFLAGGVCALPFVVMRVDPETLATRVVLEHDPPVVGGAASIAIEHDGVLWVGTFAGDRLLRRSGG